MVVTRSNTVDGAPHSLVLASLKNHYYREVEARNPEVHTDQNGIKSLVHLSKGTHH